MAKKSIRVEVDEELHQRLKIKSAVTGKPITEFIRERLRHWVNEEKPIILPPDKK